MDAILRRWLELLEETHRDCDDVKDTIAKRYNLKWIVMKMDTIQFQLNLVVEEIKAVCGDKTTLMDDDDDEGVDLSKEMPYFEDPEDDGTS
jgi:hypothetical protein